MNEHRPGRKRRTAVAIATLLAACQGPPSIDPPTEEAFQAPGTQRMAERMALLTKHAREQPDIYMNQQQAALLERLALPTDPEHRIESERRLSLELLRAGRTEDAVTRLENLLKGGEATGLQPDLESTLRRSLATAYLRLGEQRNCLENHSIDACLLPIRGDGVHRLQEGSRAAISELIAVLRHSPEDLEARWLLNLAAMTVGDYPDGVPKDYQIPPSTFASDRDIGRFFDAAAGAGVAAMGLAGGSVLEDFDNDGNLDLMVSSWGFEDSLRFFRNLGNGRYEELTREAGLTGLTGGLNLIHADYDNDGLADVLVLRGAWRTRTGRRPNSLLRNRGPNADGIVTFEDVTEEAGLLTFRPTQTAAWGDYNNDGWLDLFIGNESFRSQTHACQLFRSDGADSGTGKVTFTEVAIESGVDVVGMVKGVAWGDADNDGWLDLYVSRLGEPNLLFHNQSQAGEPRFREVGAGAGVAEPRHSFPTWFWDFDNDGWLDLFVSGYAVDYLNGGAGSVAADMLGLPRGSAETPRLYRNLGAEAGGILEFEDVTVAAGLSHVLLTMGSNFGDLNNDGFLDAYFGTGAPSFRALVPNRMFLSDAGRRFLDITTSGGFGHLQKGHGVSFGDVDNDGDQDVYAVIGGAFSGDIYPNVLFENPGHGNRWLTLRLEGTAANRSAIGARLRLVIQEPEGGREIHATVGTGGSFGSSSLQQEIGLGAASVVDTLEIRWPGSDTVQVFRDLSPDKILRIREGEPELEEIAADSTDLSRQAR